MEESTNPPQVPSNCTSPVCSDPAHDDLALHAEWSDEDRDCDGDGPHRVVGEHEDHDVPDVRVCEEEDQDRLANLACAMEPHMPALRRLHHVHAMKASVAAGCGALGETLVNIVLRDGGYWY